jgi:hypothetical protein
MIRYLKNRFHAYIQGIIAEKVDAIAVLAAERVDVDSVVDTALDRVKTGHTVEYDRLAECIDIEELAQQFDTADLAGEMDYSSLAGEVHLPELAREFDVSDLAAEIDVSEVASAFDEDSIADRVIESLDYKVLAGAILRELRTEPVTVRPSA